MGSRPHNVVLKQISIHKLYVRHLYAGILPGLCPVTCNVERTAVHSVGNICVKGRNILYFIFRLSPRFAVVGGHKVRIVNYVGVCRAVLYRRYDVHISLFCGTLLEPLGESHVERICLKRVKALNHQRLTAVGGRSDCRKAVVGVVGVNGYCRGTQKMVVNVLVVPHNRVITAVSLCPYHSAHIVTCEETYALFVKVIVKGYKAGYTGIIPHKVMSLILRDNHIPQNEVGVCTGKCRFVAVPAC